MKRLTPDKRNKLIGVTVATLTAIGLIYYFLIGPEIEAKQKLAKDIKTAAANLETIKKTIKQASINTGTLEAIQTSLSKAEEDTASGDLFAWTYDAIRRMKVGSRVDIPDIGQPTQYDADIIPFSSYRQIKVRIRGFGYYHDIGKFLSDIENRFAHVRFENVVLEPDTTSSSGGGEKLQFRAELVALVKPTS
jgi:Tfp pilus assembly protein PilO